MATFIDFVRIHVEAGHGGNGCLSFRREKYVPKGGPNGGNGGNGGSVYCEASRHINTLYELSLQHHWRAQRGAHGKGSNQTGASAKDLIIGVPQGVVIQEINKDQKTLLGELLQDGQRLLVAAGGKGGRGNTAFKSSTNRAPRQVEEGQVGEKKYLEMELKLLADIGLLGFPNAGKSTLLSRITRARPKVADYPFTTLNPVLGVCSWKGKSFVMADIPGLIEGAHQGKGLGDTFLRHIERTRVLLHLVDPMGFRDISALQSVRLLNKELKAFSPTLIKRPRILVVTKSDLGDIAQKAFQQIRRKFPQWPAFLISVHNGTGLPILLNQLIKSL